ncbi:MAG TPA: hypothetical protein VIW29_11585 [Polyangiaceae bacterium]
MTDDEQAPPRLVQMLGPAGDCVRDVLTREQQALRPPPRFALVRERRLRNVQRQRGLALLAVVGVLIGVRALRYQEPLPDIRAEFPVSYPNPQPSAAAVSTLPAERPRESSALPVRNPESVTPASPRAVAPRSSRPSLARADVHDPPSSAVAAGASDAAVGGGAKACAQLARGGASEQALACYAQLARGTGMSAELALFEQARLEGKALRRPDRALNTIDEYRRRFPSGSLRAEVMLAQIDWLLASGNSPRALQVVDEALASGLLRERTLELERLRTKLSASSRE